MNYDKECERLMKANAELSLLREFEAAVRASDEHMVDVAKVAIKDISVAQFILESRDHARNIHAALARLDDGRKG